MKKKKNYLIDVSFSTDKNLAKTQDRQTPQNSDEKYILSCLEYDNF